MNIGGFNRGAGAPFAYTMRPRTFGGGSQFTINAGETRYGPPFGDQTLGAGGGAVAAELAVDVVAAGGGCHINNNTLSQPLQIELVRVDGGDLVLMSGQSTVGVSNALVPISPVINPITGFANLAWKFTATGSGSAIIESATFWGQISA